MPEILDIEISSVDLEDRSYVFRHTTEVGDLENSLKYEGLIHPPTLLAKGARFLIVAGYLRVLAARGAGLGQVRAVVYAEGEMEREDLLKIAIAENTKRRDLTPVEVAEALARIQSELGLTDEELAEDFGAAFGLGRDPAKVKRYLELNRFDAHAKDVLAQSAEPAMAFNLLDVQDKGDREALLGLLEEHKDMKKAQFGKMIDGANKLREREDAPGFKSVLKQGSMKKILEDAEMPGAKKITAFLAELEKQAEPERLEKERQMTKLVGLLDQALTTQNPALVKKVSVSKPEYGKSKVKITLQIESTEELVAAMKAFYEAKSSVFGPLFKL